MHNVAAGEIVGLDEALKTHLQNEPTIPVLLVSCEY